MSVMAPPMRIPAGRWQQAARVFGTIGPMLSELTDVQVASGFRAGNEDSLAEAYRRWSRLVHATAMRSTGNAEDAADITQTVFVDAWRGRETYRPEAGTLPGWLMTITRRRIADHCESRTRDARVRLGRGVGGAGGRPGPPRNRTHLPRRCSSPTRSSAWAIPQVG